MTTRRRSNTHGPELPACGGLKNAYTTGMNARRPVVLLWLTMAAFHSPLLAQSEAIDQTAWKRGYNGFALVCRSMNLQIETDLRAWRSVPPKRSLLIVLGSTERLPLDVVDYVNRGGAALVASDRRDYQTFSEWGVGFNRGPQQAVREVDMFRSRSDCPVVTKLARSHPVTEACESLVTNRPGHLTVIPNLGSQRYRRATIAELPALRSRQGRRMLTDLPFLVSLEPTADSRVLLIADQSVFSNQMMTCGNNAKFALQSLKWLREEDRDTVLIVAAREVIDPTSPEMLQVLLPAPDPEEVIAALEQLPPEALIAFANAAVTAVEDEGVIDELLTHAAQEVVPYQVYARALILLATVFALTHLMVRLFNRRSDSEDKSATARSRRARSMLERQQAAKLLLARFRAKVTGSVATPWNVFTSAIQIPGDPQGTKIVRREVSAAARQSSRQKYWTRRRLEQLRKQVVRWQQLQAHGVLKYDSSGLS